MKDMVLEIHYKGEIIKEIEFPDDVNSDHLQFRSRRESKMNKQQEVAEPKEQKVEVFRGKGRQPTFYF